MGSQGSLGLSEHRPWRWRTFPPSLSAEDLRMAHPRAIGYSCALECLCLCQGGCCLPPAHVLHGQCTRQPSPTVYTIRGASGLTSSGSLTSMPSLQAPGCSF